MQLLTNCRVEKVFNIKQVCKNYITKSSKYGIRSMLTNLLHYNSDDDFYQNSVALIEQKFYLGGN